MLGSKTLGTKCIRTSLCIMLANHDQNIESRFRLAQSVFTCKSWNQVIARFIGLNLQGSINQKLDSINRTSCRLIFFAKFSNSTQARFDMQGFMFYSKYKKKNPSYVLEVFDVLCVKSFVRSKGVYLHTYLGLSRSRLCQELSDRFSCCIKNLKKI